MREIDELLEKVLSSGLSEELATMTVVLKWDTVGGGYLAVGGRVEANLKFYEQRPERT